jgi:hypothetical protein
MYLVTSKPLTHVELCCCHLAHAQFSWMPAQVHCDSLTKTRHACHPAERPSMLCQIHRQAARLPSVTGPCFTLTAVPRARLQEGVTEEDYYYAEYTAQEREEGAHLAAMKFVSVALRQLHLAASSLQTRS